MANQNLILHNEHHPLSLEEKHSFLQEDLYTEISIHGFENVEWDPIPDKLLLYIHLHTDTTLRKQRSDRTKRKYLETLRPFVRYGQDYGGLQAIFPQRVYAYQLYLERTNGYKASTLARHSTMSKQFLLFLHQEDMIATDLTTKLASAAQLADEHVDRNLFLYPLMDVLSSTGIRIEELANTKWRHLLSHASIRTTERYLLLRRRKNYSEHAELKIDNVSSFRRQWCYLY